ncbi:MAG TPA: hypothetical protein VH253_14665 [Phycisphaerae bacterium]|nr:hypothetical protein [Phycisphaerae bacterium]
MSQAQTQTKRVKKQAPVKVKPVSLSSIAARVLGRCRVMEGGSFQVRWAVREFPTLNSTELEAVLGELVDNELVTESGEGEQARYEMTERGRAARVTVV